MTQNFNKKLKLIKLKVHRATKNQSDCLSKRKLVFVLAQLNLSNSLGLKLNIERILFNLVEHLSCSIINNNCV